MQSVTHPSPGYIAVTSGDLARFASFTTCLINLLVPNGSGWGYIHGNGFAIQRNLLIRLARKELSNFEWVWFIDDDHTFDPRIILQLLSRDVDIIQPLVATRKPPYRPYCYLHDGQDYITSLWGDLPATGIMRVDAVGTGGMLIRRHVIEAMEDPWFEEGKLEKDGLGEDLYFCTKARELGFEIYVDTDVRMGHTSIHTVWPNRPESPDAPGWNGYEGWAIDLDLGHGVVTRVPPHIGIKTLAEV